MINGKPKLIMFDWSGTISDDRWPVYQANLLLSQHYGLSTPESFEDWLLETTRGPHEYYEKRGVKATHNEIWSTYKVYFDDITKQGVLPTMYTEVPSVLDALQSDQKNLVVLSSHPEDKVREDAQRYGIADYFHTIIGDVYDKAESMKLVCREHDLDPDDVMHVGDMMSDIEASHKASIRIIALTRGYHPRFMLEPLKPYRLYDNLTESLSDFV